MHRTKYNSYYHYLTPKFCRVYAVTSPSNFSPPTLGIPDSFCLRKIGLHLFSWLFALRWYKLILLTGAYIASGSNTTRNWACCGSSTGRSRGRWMWFFLKRIFLFHEYLIVLRTDSKNRLHPQRDSAKTLHIAQKSLSCFAILYQQSPWEIA